MLPVTAIIPTCNNRPTVDDAIRSALEQTEPPAQLVVVDDGSTDGTADALRVRYGNRVDLIVTENGGPSRARNAGLAKAREPYVAFLDADDVWHPEKLSCQWRFLEDHAAVATVATDWVRRADAWPAAIPTPLPTTPMTYRDLLVLNRFQTSTVMVRTTVLRAVRGFDPALDGVEDWDLWVRLAAVGGLTKIDVPLVQYRDVPTGYSKNLARVYQTMPGLLDKQRASQRVTTQHFRQIESWHHLRFAVAFYLMGDTVNAAAAWRGAWRDKPSATRALVRYLLPFMLKRLGRRIA